MSNCLECNSVLEGRQGKKFCNSYCKSSFHYKNNRDNENTFYENVLKQLRLNRKLLKKYNKAGKSIVRKNELLNAGFNPNRFTHYWKNNKGEVYLFCFEFGFLEKKEGAKQKYVLVKWQDYME